MSAHNPMPRSAWVFPALAVLLFAAVSATDYVFTLSFAGLVFAIVLLVILFGTVFAAVHHAEVIAERVGEPYGTLVLTLAVTIIEVALITTIMLGDKPAPALARDTVFAVVMIVCNGLVGLCIFIGGLRYREQGFQLSGANVYLSVLFALATITLILPNYTTTAPRPVSLAVQLGFVDVPGHERFVHNMLAGATGIDTVLLVVAADDGVMPQTLEAISHAKAAKVPIIIALNKIDKPDADPTRVKTELTEAGIVIEEYGGDVPLVPVSAKSRQGLDELIEMVLLVADLQELKANPERQAVGTIVEAQMDKSRGAVATALVQTGTLKVGDIIVVGETFGRVRALENDRGKRVKAAGPASAVVILGLSEVPAAGDILRVVADEKAARAMVEQRTAALAAKAGDASGRATLEDLYRQIQAGQAKELRIILKADVSGSLGAITHALDQLDQDEVRVNVLHEAAGDITDNDIMLATASNAIVVGFSTRITETARRAADAEGVDVRLYDIIYKLTDDIDAALKGLLEPEIVEIVEGRAEVRQVIKVGKSTQIAGSYVTDGRIVRGGARIWRSGKVIATDRIESLRRFRDDVREVQANYECGIGLANFHDLVEGDIIECFTSQTISRVAAG